jgi:hypothetical protein
VRCSFRLWLDPGYWGDDVGFRLLLSPK